MAERSTAAVDVANESGDTSLTAEAGGATGDEANGHDAQAHHAEGSDTPDRDARAQADTPDGAQDGAAETAPESADHGPDEAQRTVQVEPARPATELPELHSGHRLLNRYHLEECVAQADGFSSWRAVDEKLRRAVGVHLLPANHPRAHKVLSAARAAALLGDPRFVKVLDAVEEDDLVYVVHEWLPDATELAAVLAAGPLATHDAYQLVSQISQAMSAAHREGLAHLRLGPGSVLRSESGQYRIRGLAVAAALHGVESDRPKRIDTEAIGALLYAALTARWPYPEDAHGLSGLPEDLGLVPPDQVRAGVHRGLSDLVMRALVNDGATPSRREPPITTPEELAQAVAALPKIRPPEPETPVFPPNGYRQPPARPAQVGTAQQSAATVPPPPALSGRTGRAVKWSVAGLLIAALGLGSWQVAGTLMSRGTAVLPSSTPQIQKDGGGKTSQVAQNPLRITAAEEYAPFGDPQHPDQVDNTYDNNSSTYWRTKSYYGDQAVLAPYKPGVGITYDLGSRQAIGSATIHFLYSGVYTAASLYAADSLGTSTPPSQLKRLASATTNGSSMTLTVKNPVATRFVVVWLTALPKAPADTYSKAGHKQGITGIQFLGR